MKLTDSLKPVSSEVARLSREATLQDRRKDGWKNLKNGKRRAQMISSWEGGFKSEGS